MSKLLNLLIILFFLSCTISPQVKVQVDRRRVKVGEPFTYMVMIKGEFLEPKVILPQFKRLTVLARRQIRRRDLTKRGVFLKLNIEYKLIAFEPGEYIIEKVVIEDKHKRFESENIVIKVEDSSFWKKKLEYLQEEGIEI